MENFNVLCLFLDGHTYTCTYICYLCMNGMCYQCTIKTIIIHGLAEMKVLKTYLVAYNFPLS
jgi:hypothetical protein